MNKTLNSAFIISCFIVSPVVAAVSDYDGKWNGEINCTAYVGTASPAFTRNNQYDIRNGRITAKYSTKDKDAVNSLSWEGVVNGGAIKLTGTGRQEGGGTWTYEFSGNVDANNRITVVGALIQRGAKRRDCKMEFTSVEPAANSLAATSVKPSSVVAQAPLASDSAKSQAEVAKIKAEADRAQAEAAKARAEAAKAEAEAQKAKTEAAEASEQAKAAAAARANEKAKSAAIVKTSAVSQAQDRTTPPPKPIAATQATSNATPARSAAIGNVAEPLNPPKGSEKFNQITANPIDARSKLSSNQVWVSFNPSITVQERQFCRIIENFRTESAAAAATNNQIKVNETFRNFVQSLNSLLPDGKFQGWLMRMVNVSQASDGSAEVLLEMPCNVYVGSNACDANPKNFYGTAPEGSRIYSEFAKMTVGDFALTSGQFLYTDEKAFDKGRSVASFRYMRTGSHCKAKAIGKDSEFFGLKVDVISTIK